MSREVECEGQWRGGGDEETAASQTGLGHLHPQEPGESILRRFLVLMVKVNETFKAKVRMQGGWTHLTLLDLSAFVCDSYVLMS